MKSSHYLFFGYANYKKILPCLQKDLAVLNDPDYHYEIAINEAVCNAARYAIAGINEVEIRIDVYLREHDIKTVVSAQTKLFNTQRYQDKLKKLAQDPTTRDLEWGDYTADTERSRGFWFMLMSCNHLYIDSNGQRITLCARTDFNPSQIVTQIHDLVPKFLIEKEGVIL